MDPSDDPAPAREIGRAVRTMLQAGRDMQAALARRLGIGDTDLAAMDHLVSSADPLGPVELGHRLGIRSASATVLVDRLESAGHLRRERHPRDRRRITLHPTDAARAEVRGALTPLLDSVAEITGRLDPAQAQTVLTFLEEITTAMRVFSAETGPPAASPDAQAGR